MKINKIDDHIFFYKNKTDLVLSLCIAGVLSQEMLDKEALLFPNKHSYIPASYLKYIEGAGARGVPIL